MEKNIEKDIINETLVESIPDIIRVEEKLGVGVLYLS